MKSVEKCCKMMLFAWPYRNERARWISALGQSSNDEKNQDRTSEFSTTHTPSLRQHYQTWLVSGTHMYTHTAPPGGGVVELSPNHCVKSKFICHVRRTQQVYTSQ